MGEKRHMIDVNGETHRKIKKLAFIIRTTMKKVVEERFQKVKV